MKNAPANRIAKRLNAIKLCSRAFIIQSLAIELSALILVSAYFCLYTLCTLLNYHNDLFKNNSQYIVVNQIMQETEVLFQFSYIQKRMFLFCFLVYFSMLIPNLKSVFFTVALFLSCIGKP